MKEIKLDTWDAKLPNGTVIQETLVTVLSVVLSASMESLPKGMDGFRLMKRIADAFDSADKTGTLKLEDADYLALKTFTEKNIPPKLALNVNIVSAVDKFLSL